jgi:methanogenic corrinoid protein MtbC1
MIPEDLAGRIMEAVLTGDGPGAQAAAEAGVAAGHAPEALVASFITAIQEVGRLWEAGDFFLPELVAGGRRCKGASGCWRDTSPGAATRAWAGWPWWAR